MSQLDQLRSVLHQIDHTIKKAQTPTHEFTSKHLPAMAPVTAGFTAGMRDAREAVGGALGHQAGATIMGHLRQAQDHEEKAMALLEAVRQHLTLANLSANQGLTVLDRTISTLNSLGH